MSKKVLFFFIKPRSTNLESKQKTGNKQHEVFPYKEREQSSANKLKCQTVSHSQKFTVKREKYTARP